MVQTKMVIYLGTFAFILFGLSSQAEAQNASNYLENVMYSAMNTASSPPPSTFPSTVELIKKRGYGAAKHKVITEDGYILTLHHIIKSQGPPVLIMHGFLAASDQWLMIEKNLSLPFALADAGFDVWLGNQRGSYYSRQHKSYSKTDPRFWNFSFHESGIYDLPAFIDFILNKNAKYRQLFYVGHSMGTTVFLVMSSVRPEYGRKVRAAFFLAPIAYPPAKEELSPALRIVDNADTIAATLARRNLYEFLPRNGATMKLTQSFCSAPSTQPVCFELVNQVSGENKNNWNKQKIGFYFSSVPAGTSLKTAHHLSQVYRTGLFRQYDYGRKNNILVYGSVVPPEYNVTRVKSKIILYQGLNDRLMNTKTAAKLAYQLPNLVKNVVIEDPKYSHLDFLFGLNSKGLIYDDITKLMLHYSKGKVL